MKIFLVFAHPELKSFNGALFNTALSQFESAGHEVKTSDLYRMNYNPVSDRRNFTTTKDADFYKQQIEELYATECGGFAADVEEEMQKLEWCDFLLLQFPLWWFGLPAIMKGWVDKTFAMGRTYGRNMRYATGKFHGKRAMCSLTTGGAEAHYVKGGEHGEIMQTLHPINHGMLGFVGFEPIEPHIVYAPAHMTEEQRSVELERFKARLAGPDFQ